MAHDRPPAPRLARTRRPMPRPRAGTSACGSSRHHARFRPRRAHSAKKRAALRAAISAQTGDDAAATLTMVGTNQPEQLGIGRQPVRSDCNACPISRAPCRISPPACRPRTWSTICRTTSSPRSTAAPWLLRSKHACRCLTIASSNSSGRCRVRCGAAASRRRCSSLCWRAICRCHCLIVPSAVFRCRSANGCPVRLRGWADDLLSPAKLANEGLLDSDAVQRLWQRHLSKREQNATALWNILMLRAWSERWLKR